MQNKDIEQRIRALMADVAPPEKLSQELKADDSLIADLGLDSMEMVQLVVSIEEEFNIIIDDRDISIDTFQTIASITHYLTHVLTTTPYGRETAVGT